MMQALRLTNNESDDPFENEDPSPSSLATNTGHLHEAASEQSTKGAGRCGGREEDGHAEATFMASVPQCNTALISQLEVY